MAKNTVSKTSVDYDPAMAEAQVLAQVAGRAWERYDKRVKAAEASITAQCVVAVRAAMSSGYLVDGRDKDSAPGAVNRREYALNHFGLTNGSQVSQWATLAHALDAGVEIDSPEWTILALQPHRAGRRKGMDEALKNAKSVEDVRTAIRDLAKINPETGVALPGTGSGSGAKGARPGGSSEKAEDGIPVTEDPVVDALLAITALKGACKRIPADNKAGWSKVSQALNEVIRRETTLRPPRTKPTPKTAPLGVAM